MSHSAEASSNGCSHVRVVLAQLISHASFELPLLPESATSLLSMCSDRECPPQNLVEAIRRDPSIATHVLKIANSARYSPEAQIVSLQHAVARLGMQRIREIVLIVSCHARVFDVAEFETQIRHSFRISMATAAFAQEVARTRRLNVEDAFLCGLLHDIGRPVLLQALADYEREKNLVFDRDEVSAAIEEHRLGVGKRLIEAWGLPSRVADAVGNQREVSSDMSQGVAVLILAIALAQALIDPENHEMSEVSNHPTVARLNIYQDQFAMLCLKTHEILDFINRI